MMALWKFKKKPGVNFVIFKGKRSELATDRANWSNVFFLESQQVPFFDFSGLGYRTVKF